MEQTKAPVTPKWLVTFRNAKNMTQEQVTEECLKRLNVKISRSAYVKYELGLIQPTPEKAQAIGAVLGFPWTFFYTQECSLKEHQT